MPEDITALRSELFATLRALRDKDNPLDVKTAAAVTDVARVIIDTARVEVDMARATQHLAGSGFIPLAAPTTPAAAPTLTGPATAAPTPPPSTTVEAIPGGRRITHRMAG